MDEPTPAMSVVCVASYFKGEEFLREAGRLGANVSLVTRERTRHEPWPHESLAETVFLPDEAGAELVIHAVSQLARRRPLSAVVALEEFDVITAALAREHLCLEGLGSTEARRFRDKLTMRIEAAAAGIRVPEFVHALNYQQIGEYMERVPPPWVLKPRSDVSSSGVRLCREPEEVWRAIEELDARPSLQDRAPYYLLERYVAGEVFHVDSLVEDGRVVFAGASRYGRPPMEVAHGGGVFLSHTVEYDSPDHEALTRMNAEVLGALGLGRGAAHAEFIKGTDDGELYFLEVAARVGGAFIAETLEAATGVNLWREWARLEVSHAGGRPLEKLEPERAYSGIALSLARQEWPDTSAYDDPEIVRRTGKPYHVGLIVRSESLERVCELLAGYAERFARDFSAYVPPPERREVNL
jgi:biotin carboxylase